MNNLQYPITFSFKITTLSNDFTAKNASGQTIAYVKQKMFKLKEAINVYSDESKTKILFTIAANKWLDFSAAYSMYDQNNTEIGKIARKGWRSMWKAEYDIVNQNDQPQYKVQEENAWVRIADSLLGGIPIIGAFTGYLFNPTYNITNKAGQIAVKLKKMPSFFGKEFELTKVADIDEDDKERVMLGLMMMILLERRRG
ncbi:hypothetical protein CW736_13725 [Nonlabens sp. MB-3u-79]|uniref:hypothetical protein n=1 Tax=Nonlabens sp. MB-3u-79 TaxID=2058134 RepID=UPI000C30B08C|nr:hypothetical protein [Nonlabens sp. MB-3u-79]AUC80371.1 hypothetical protein CW736_13725 [Nonlabens sp. MB-3u-79]